MRRSRTVAVALALYATLAHAQTLSQSSITSALQAQGLTSFARLLASSNGTSLLDSIASAGAGTIFAPSNGALVNTSALSTNQLAYHVARGSFPASSLSTVDSIVRSYYSDGVSLPGNQSQVLVVGLSGSNVQVRQGLGNSTSINATQSGGLVIYAMSAVLSLPTDLATTAGAAGLTSLVQVLTTQLPTLVPALLQTRGITVFAPMNSAFSTTGLVALISSIPAGSIANVLGAHVVNGTVVYSNEMVTGSGVVPLGGVPLSFITNSTGTFVVGELSTVKILIPDVPIANGVVHVIDSVIVSTSANADQAASAASSAYAQAATQSAPQTGFVTATLANYGSASNSAPTGATASKPASNDASSRAVTLVTLFSLLALAIHAL